MPGIQFQLRRDTSANWISADTVLAEGEIGYETDTRQKKIGDGSTPWTSLPYYQHMYAEFLTATLFGAL